MSKPEWEQLYERQRRETFIAFPWPSLDVPVAMTSWGCLQRFTTFDPKLASAFIQANRNKAPEPNAQ